MKKIILILTVLLIAVFNISPLIILLETDEVDEAYLEKTYGKPVTRDLAAERLVFSEFQIFMEFALENAAVIEDEEKQLEEYEKLKSLEFKPKKMIFFRVRTSTAIPKAYLKFNTELINAKGESIIHDSFTHSIKYTVTNNIMGVPVRRIYYDTYWIIEVEKQLVKKNYKKDEQPIKFIITFPNGQKRVYKVKL